MPPKEEIMIQVTQRHINLGIRAHHAACPIALALTGSGYFQPSVDLTLIKYVNPRGSTITRRTSEQLNDFMISFDNENLPDPSPFEFSLFGLAIESIG